MCIDTARSCQSPELFSPFLPIPKICLLSLCSYCRKPPPCSPKPAMTPNWGLANAFYFDCPQSGSPINLHIAISGQVSKSDFRLVAVQQPDQQRPVQVQDHQNPAVRHLRHHLLHKVAHSTLHSISISHSHSPRPPTPLLSITPTIYELLPKPLRYPTIRSFTPPPPITQKPGRNGYRASGKRSPARKLPELEIDGCVIAA